MPYVLGMAGLAYVIIDLNYHNLHKVAIKMHTPEKRAVRVPPLARVGLPSRCLKKSSAARG